MDVTVTDNQGVTPVLQSGDDNSNGLLDPGETWIYTAAGTAIVGQYNNTGTVTAYDATGTIAQPLTVTSSDGYFGVQPGIKVVKLTNGQDNANANIEAGTGVTWTYEITNTGNVALSGVALGDDAGVIPILQSNGNGDSVLDVGETWVFAATGTAIVGQYSNTATATGTDATGTVTTPVTSSEGDGYFGVQPGIKVVKLTNGQDNANANIAAGSTVTWTYNVTNTGDVALSGVAVTDSAGVTPVLSKRRRQRQRHAGPGRDLGLYGHRHGHRRPVHEHRHRHRHRRHRHGRHSGHLQRGRRLLRRAAGHQGRKTDQRPGQRQCQHSRRQQCHLDLQRDQHRQCGPKRRGCYGQRRE